MLASSRDMDDRRSMLDHFALVVREMGALSLASTEELKDILLHHFGICKHEVYICCSKPNPFMIIFAEQHSRDLVFAAGRVIDGPVELSFHAWGLDKFGDRTIIPYHIRLSIEGMPHHASHQEVTEKVLCDEAIIHHVEEESRRRTGLRAYRCWAFSKDPSKISQTVFLTITEPKTSLLTAQVHFVRPREVVNGHVFKILIHLDVVEDLMFYHYPRDELLADGKVPWREFSWQFGLPGDAVSDDSQIPTRFCAPAAEGWRHRDDDEGDRDQERHRGRGLMQRMAHWIDGRGRSKSWMPERNSYRGWYRGEASWSRNLADYSPPPSRWSRPPDEKRALRGLW
jgi:hypothetical protein